MRSLPLFLILSLSISATLHAQLENTAIFASVSGYRNTGFENNLFTNAELGVSLWNDKILSPEIGIGFSGASLKNQVRVFENNGVETEQQIRTQRRAFLLSAGVNLRLTKRESYWISAFSKVNYLPTNRFTSRLFEGANVNSLPLIETLEAQSASTFFDFGLGIEGFVNEKETWSGSLAVVYTTNAAFDSFNDLEFEASNQNINFPSNGAIGLRFLGRFHL
jgi:hypothetical protein